MHPSQPASQTSLQSLVILLAIHCCKKRLESAGHRYITPKEEGGGGGGGGGGEGGGRRRGGRRRGGEGGRVHNPEGKVHIYQVGGFTRRGK